MKRNLYFIPVLLLSLLIVELAIEYLQVPNTDWRWTEPIIILLIGLFWIEFFRVKYKEKGLWQIVSSSIRDKFSLVIHLIICTFLIGWTYQLKVMPIYRVLIWFILFVLVSLSFYLTSTQESKPLIKRYFFDKW
jgi:hypothetical protein